MIDLNNENIEINSFYDVNQKMYTDEELKLYHDLAGLPLFSSYEELMDSLDADQKKQNNKTVNGNQKIKKM